MTLKCTLVIVTSYIKVTGLAVVDNSKFYVILGLCSAAAILVPQKSNFIFDTSLTFKIDAEL